MGALMNADIQRRSDILKTIWPQRRRLLGWLTIFLLIPICCQGSKIHGVVTDKDGKPIAGALIFVSALQGDHLSFPSGDHVTLTDAAGHYSLDPGRNKTHLYRLNISHEDFEPLIRQIDTATMKSADFVLKPIVVYNQTYKIGDEVQARSVEWCPARITDIGAGKYAGYYKIEFTDVRENAARLMLRAKNIR